MYTIIYTHIYNRMLDIKLFLPHRLGVCSSCQ